MKILQGDLITLALEGEFDVIVHGCNCFCTMGSGIAKRIREEFPEAYKADLRTKKGAYSKLGMYSSAAVGDLIIVNAYTQYRYGYDGVRYVDYEAVRKVFSRINKHFAGLHIGFPMIGAGLGGGDWWVIGSIIDDVLVDVDATLVIFE